jgi:hypothetical protein
VLAVLAALVGPAGAASAAARPAPKAHASARTTVGTAAAAKARSKPVTKPVAPVKASATAAAHPDQRLRQRSASAALTRARSRAGATSTCSGAIVPDTVYSCSSPSTSGTDSFTLPLPNASDLVVVRLIGTSGGPTFTLTAPDGTSVNCPQPQWYQLPQCATTKAGAYTLQVQSGGASAYTLSYVPLLSDSSCKTADPSFATPTIQGSLSAGSAGDCYTLAAASGHILHGDSTATGQYLVTVYDTTGALVCFDDQGDCPLTGTGPYRVLVDDQYGNADSYELQLNDITQPTGCVTAPQGVYGAAPDASSADRCRTLQVTTAGQYQIYAVSTDYSGLSGTLYLPNGTATCTNGGPTCQLMPGAYNFVANPIPSYVAHFGVVFIAANEGRGCAATGDTDFVTGAVQGTFSGTGDVLCLTLPTAAGHADYLLNQPTADGSSPQQLQVFDATGTQMCSNFQSNVVTCALTGTAPFHVVLSGQPDKAGYKLLVQRTDSQAGCKVWPQSGFGGSWGATVSLTAASNTGCLSIPANQHSTGEMIDYANNANVVDGSVYVNDPTGKNICIGASTAGCTFTPGVTYTALVFETSGSSDTYRLVRRDISSTATCPVASSTAVGGPSTTYLLGSDLDTRCVRVTGAATDKYALGVRASGANQSGAVLQVANASGTVICRQWGTACKVTGSATYQVLITAVGYRGVAITAHVSTWRIGTASGWAPQCQAHPLSGAAGWAPFTTRLSESVTGYCAVVSVQANQMFTVYSLPGAGQVGSPWFNLYNDTNWTQFGLCGQGNGYLQCGPSSNQAGQYLLLVEPYQAALPLDFTMQAVCNLGCTTQTPAPVVTSVTPSTAAAETTSQVVVHGTNLNLGTRIVLAQNGVTASSYPVTYPLSLSKDGTALTMQLATYGVAPGTYDVAMAGIGYTVGTPSPGYLPGAFKVTAAPATPPNGTFVPDGPVRVLDTRSGLGAPRAHVGSGGTVRLQIAGKAGIPTSGVTAVVLNVSALSPTRPGYLAGYPDGTARPGVTDLTFLPGQTQSDQVVVPVVNGRVDLYNGSSGTVDLTADLAGYFTSSGSHSLRTAVGPARLLNTRTGLGAPKAHVAAGGTVRLKVTGHGGVPASGVSAVELNVTALAPARGGYLTLYPDGARRPVASQVSFAPGQSVAGLVLVPVVNGSVDLFNGSGGSVDLTADVTGYYGATGSWFRSAGPARVLDTRSGLGGVGVTIQPHSSAQFNVTSLPSWPNVGASAVVLSVSATGAQSAGSLTVFADSQSLPAQMSLLFPAHGTITNQIVVPVVNGDVDFVNNSGGTVQVFADLQGWFGPSS